MQMILLLTKASIVLQMILLLTKASIALLQQNVFVATKLCHNKNDICGSSRRWYFNTSVIFTGPPTPVWFSLVLRHQCDFHWSSDTSGPPMKESDWLGRGRWGLFSEPIFSGLPKHVWCAWLCHFRQSNTTLCSSKYSVSSRALLLWLVSCHGPQI